MGRLQRAGFIPIEQSEDAGLDASQVSHQEIRRNHIRECEEKLHTGGALWQRCREAETRSQRLESELKAQREDWDAERKVLLARIGMADDNATKSCQASEGYPGSPIRHVACQFEASPSSSCVEEPTISVLSASPQIASPTTARDKITFSPNANEMPDAAVTEGCERFNDGAMRSSSQSSPPKQATCKGNHESGFDTLLAAAQSNRKGTKLRSALSEPTDNRYPPKVCASQQEEKESRECHAAVLELVRSVVADGINVQSQCNVQRLQSDAMMDAVENLQQSLTSLASLCIAHGDKLTCVDRAQIATLRDRHHRSSSVPLPMSGAVSPVFACSGGSWPSSASSTQNPLGGLQSTSCSTVTSPTAYSGTHKGPRFTEMPSTCKWRKANFAEDVNRDTFSACLSPRCFPSSDCVRSRVHASTNRGRRQPRQTPRAEILGVHKLPDFVYSQFSKIKLQPPATSRQLH